MWSVLPARGEEVDLDVAATRPTPIEVRAAIVEAAEDHLVVAPRFPLRLPRPADLLATTVLAHWTDIGGGLCSLPTVLAEADAERAMSSWLLRATGPLTRLARRRYVRELVRGRVRITPRDASHIQVDGDIVDISEGGLLLRSRDATLLWANGLVDVTVEMDGGDQAIHLRGRVVRSEFVDGTGHAAVSFPDGHPYMDVIRKSVFDVERERRRRELDMELDPSRRLR